jgi:pimeloyl-ACP methyl ester carboxylesterase
MGNLIFQSLAKENFDLTGCLSRFNKPVYIITGVQDPLGFLSYEVKIVSPKAKLYGINNAGHFPMYEQPKKFFSEIFKALEEK